jgi:hypothetical protein
MHAVGVEGRACLSLAFDLGGYPPVRLWAPEPREDALCLWHLTWVHTPPARLWVPKPREEPPCLWRLTWGEYPPVRLWSLELGETASNEAVLAVVWSQNVGPSVRVAGLLPMSGYMHV